MTDRFVVGTGRCGSTLLSTMLADHREVVSIHEFLTGLDWGRRFVPGPVDGDALADLISGEQPVTTEVLARGHTSDEIQYPFGAPQARHAVGDPVPWLLITALSRLTEDPDPLFDEFVAHARARPPATMAEHYRDLFDWLARRAGGSVWVERSGSSVDFLGDLVDLFPDGRFVHLHRDGPEAALSIRAHPFFRLAVAIVHDLFPPDRPEAEQVTYAIETPPPLWAVGRFWSDQVVAGAATWPRIPDDQFFELRFEDLVTEPTRWLADLADFLDLPPDPDFVPRAAARSRGLPPRRVDALSTDERAELEDACRPGMELLGRVD